MAKAAPASAAKKNLMHSDMLAGFVIGFVTGVLFLSFLGSMM